MPEIKFDKILSFSTEDPGFQATNLISSDSKWIGANDNNSKQYVSIKLKEQCEIRQIEVENESSAFIEIQAGNETDPEDDFSVILSAKSFMTPSESKNRLHTNRLKIFIDDLDERYLSRKFNVIKVICTQPFNTSLQFGIKSIKVFDQATVDENKKDAVIFLNLLKYLGLTAKINTGVFELKKDLPVSGLAGISLGGYKFKPTEESTTAQIGSSFQAWRKRDVEESQQQNEANKGKDEEDKANAKTESAYEKWKRSEEAKKRDETNMDSAENDQKKTEAPLKVAEAKSSNESQPEVKQRPRFNERSQTLKGVVFALSGFVNPLRSEIRDKGLRMGASYRPDWTDECTHLICAFSSTPKAAQVREGGGKVVKPEWLDECKSQDKLLDCEDFVIKKESESSASDGDDDGPRKAARQAKNKLTKLTNKAKDEFDDSYDESEAENSDDRDFIVNTSDEESVVSSSSASSSAGTATGMDSEDSERVVSKKNKPEKVKKASSKKETKKRSKKKSSNSDSDSDNDSEADTKKRKKNQNKTTKANNKENNGSSTKKFKKEADENKVLNKKESNSSSKTEVNSDLEDNENSNWELPDFFAGKHFYVYGDYDKKTKNLISRYIIGFGGDIEEYMGDKIDFVITNKSWNDEFKKSKKEHKNLVIVNDDWINACARRKKMIAYQTFEVESD